MSSEPEIKETKKKSFLTSRKIFVLKIFLALVILLSSWILIDIFGPWSANLRKFDPVATAQLETNMWRAYYDKKPLQLYWLLVKTLRTQNQMPFWQANLNAYRAARAAFVFKKGQKRSDYELAIPYLEDYFQALKSYGNLQNDPKEVAKLELEWWIVHRERKTYGEQALVDAIASTTGKIYGVDSNVVKDYATARTKAMIERDTQQEAGAVTESDWQDIESKLTTAYTSLSKTLNQ